MRLYKYIKVFAHLTEHEVKELYEENHILVNNKIMPFSYKVKDDDIITLKWEVINKVPFEYYLYYKPKGVLSDISTNEASYQFHINKDIKLMPAGRLDKDSEGLMILTNDGAFINTLSKSNIEKEYLVSLEKKVDEVFLAQVVKPIYIKSKLTKEMKVYKLDDYNIRLILFDGRYHQIRRAVKESSNKVINLKRIRIGKFLLSDMKENELRKIKKAN